MNYYVMRWREGYLSRRQSRIFTCAAGLAVAESWARAWLSVRGLKLLDVRGYEARR
jgi:hypothetical protein